MEVLRGGRCRWLRLSWTRPAVSPRPSFRSPKRLTFRRTTTCRVAGMSWTGSWAARGTRCAPTAGIRTRPSSCSTSPRTPPSWCPIPTPGRPCCACTGSATTASRRSRPSWPGWTRCVPRPGGARRGDCPPPTGGGAPRRAPPPAAGRRAVAVTARGGADPSTARHCVHFEFLPGREPAGESGGVLSGGHFAELGEITARMHQHARRWPRPAWFTRFHWDYRAAFGPGARWGRWQDGIGVGPSERQVLTRLDSVLRSRLAAFGTGPERYGLVHADTRLANLLVHDGAVSVIDFDDSGFGWYLYDLGTSVRFFEHAPELPVLVLSWLDGYHRSGELSAADQAETRRAEEQT